MVQVFFSSAVSSRVNNYAHKNLTPLILTVRKVRKSVHDATQIKSDAKKVIGYVAYLGIAQKKQNRVVEKLLRHSTWLASLNVHFNIQALQDLSPLHGLFDILLNRRFMTLIEAETWL